MLFGCMPFDLPCFTPKMPAGKMSRYLNSIQGLELYKRLSDIMMSRFKWEGLPDTCDERALEITLNYYGWALFFNDSDMGYMHTPCDLSGPYNVYYESINRHAYSYNYNKDYTIDNSILIRGNTSMIPDYIILVNYVPKIANAIRSIDVHTETLKKPFFIECEEKERKSVQRALSDVADNDIAVIGRKAVDRMSSLNVLNTGIQCYLTDMWANAQSYLQQCLNALGVDNSFSSKKERMVQAEATGNDITIRHTLENELKCRQRACELINKMYGLNVSVTANQVDAFKIEQIKEDIGFIGGNDPDDVEMGEM